MPTPALMMTTMMMTMTIMAMKSEAEVTEVRAYSGESVLLNFSLRTDQNYEVRWTHKRLLVDSNDTSGCDGERCELLGNGSLRLYRITKEYAGNYKLELFKSSSGKLMYMKEFLLRVDDSSRSSARPPVAACCSLLLLLPLLITLFVLRKRRMSKRQPISDQMENVYIEMHRSKISQEEDGHDVSCHPADSTETDIYV